jgi:hypothetical protein
MENIRGTIKNDADKKACIRLLTVVAKECPEDLPRIAKGDPESLRSRLAAAILEYGYEPVLESFIEAGILASEKEDHDHSLLHDLLSK